MKQFVMYSRILGGFLLSNELRIWLRMAVKPVAVAATLAIMVWLGAWCDTRIAHAQFQDLACPLGLEQNSPLCYPPCKDGFYGEGPICFQKCPTDYKDDGALCRKDAHIFAKASYGRGAGVGLVCASNQEAQGGLCYPKCAATHYGVGPVCWQRCPAGYADHGVTCYRGIFDFFGKNTYGRGAGGAVSACPAGMERNGALCYPRCNTGFAGAGPVCFQTCPAGYRDDGAFCRKDALIFAKASFDRGAGVVLNLVPIAENETVHTAKDTLVNLVFPVIDDNLEDSTEFIYVQEERFGNLDANTYTPNPGFEGVDTILWKATDGKNESRVAVATIIVGVVLPNQAPVAIDRTISVREDTPLTITVTCTDANNDALFYQLLTKPQHGTYKWLPPNTVIYTPTLNFVGTDSFTFQSHDGRDASNVSTITLNVAAANDAPVALAQTISTTRNSNAVANLIATDVESDTISYTLVSGPTHGLLSGEIPNLLYMPNQNFVGEDSFQFRASDSQGAATAAMMNITVLPTNTAPVAESLVLTTSQEGAVAVNLTGSDADNDPLTYTLVSSPTHGVLTSEGADWVYTPNANFIGVETFTFKANDGQADSALATVTITVTTAPAEASLIGIVFDDSNDNNQPDGNETGVSGLLVTLIRNNVQTAGIATIFTTQTDTIGAWRLDGVPLGSYTLHIVSSSGVQVKAPVEIQISVGQRGLQQVQPAAVQVSGRAIFLPFVTQ